MLATTQSGMIWITNTVTGMPVDNAYWFGVLSVVAGHRNLKVTRISNSNVSYSICYNAAEGYGWSPWHNIADDGNAATVNGFTITSGTEDLNPGVSELSTGTIYLVYE